MNIIERGASTNFPEFLQVPGMMHGMMHGMMYDAFAVRSISTIFLDTPLETVLNPFELDFLPEIPSRKTRSQIRKF